MNNKGSFWRYLKVDFYRMFHSWEFYIAGIGVFAVYLLSYLQNMGMSTVVEIFWFSKFYSMIIVLYACSNVAFSNSMLEDYEHKFCHSTLLRGNSKSYTASKAVCCFLGAQASVVMGTIYFVLLFRLRVPFIDTKRDDWFLPTLRKTDMFSALLQEKGIFLYFVMSSFVMGMLGGILSLVSMLLSLYAKNRMFSICIPVIGYYVLVNLLDEKILNISGLYLYSGKIFPSNILSFLYAVLVTSVGFIVLEKLIYRRFLFLIQGRRG